MDNIELKPYGGINGIIKYYNIKELNRDKIIKYIERKGEYKFIENFLNKKKEMRRNRKFNKDKKKFLKNNNISLIQKSTLNDLVIRYGYNVLDKWYVSDVKSEYNSNIYSFKIPLLYSYNIPYSPLEKYILGSNNIQILAKQYNYFTKLQKNYIKNYNTEISKYNIYEKIINNYNSETESESENNYDEYDENLSESSLSDIEEF